MQASDPYFLNTERMRFRTWTTEDLRLAFAIWGDPEVTRYVGGPFSREQVQEKLDREIKSQETFGVQYWPVFLSNGEHAGCAGLRPGLDRLEMGYYLLPRCWGQGLASEAGRGIAAYAFNKLGVERLVAGHHPANIASGRVLEKLGFRFSHLELYPPTGLMHPCYLLVRPTETPNQD